MSFCEKQAQLVNWIKAYQKNHNVVLDGDELPGLMLSQVAKNMHRLRFKGNSFFCGPHVQFLNTLFLSILNILNIVLIGRIYSCPS
jgi:hypothetical protein